MKNLYHLSLIVVLALFLSGCTKKPVACFVVPNESMETGVEYLFEDCSVEAAKYWWEFGDGQASDSSGGRHTYGNPGVYKMTLTVTKDGDEDVLTRTVRVESVDRTGLSAGQYTGKFTETYPGNVIYNKSYTQTLTIEAIDNNNIYISTVRGSFHATVEGTSTNYTFSSIREQQGRIADMLDGTGEFDAGGVEEFEMTLQGTDPYLGDIPWILRFRGSRP
ncbi:PKD domain-containing protein [bacterium SCSIO 12741]|nr:PKD domain-containing protein [bacterium SCSIO 12741]